MKAISNIFTFNHKELVSFLQKIGQFEAARIVKKYEIDGDMLSAFSDQEINVELTDYEKKTLLSVINCTKVTLGSLSKSKLALLDENEETTTNQDCDLHGDLSLTSSRESNKECSCEKSFINITHPEDDAINMQDKRHLEMRDLPSNDTGYLQIKHDINNKGSYEEKNRTSSKYFQFYLNPKARRKEKKVHVYPSNPHYLEPIEVTSNNFRRRSSDYILPDTHLQSRYDQITTDRIKMYLPKDYDIKVGNRTNQNNSYIEVLGPVESRSRLEKGDNTKKGPNSVCDFVLYLCGFSCFLGCKKK